METSSNIELLDFAVCCIYLLLLKGNSTGFTHEVQFEVWENNHNGVIVMPAWDSAQ